MTMQPMELIQAWERSGSLSNEEVEALLLTVETPCPRLETAECAMALGNLELFELLSQGLTQAESRMIDLVTARIEGDSKAMVNCIHVLLHSYANLNPVIWFWKVDCGWNVDCSKFNQEI